MATYEAPRQQPKSHLEIPIPQVVVVDENKEKAEESFDYSQRSQWLRAAVLGANDGLVSVASLMMGIGAVKEDVKVMLIAGFAGLIAGACSMAIGEFVSVYTQLDIETAQIKRVKRKENNNSSDSDQDQDNNKPKEEPLPNPFQAAMASAFAFCVGAMVPLLAAAFIENNKVRLGVVAAAASMALIVFGAVGAVLGRTPVVKSCARVLVGGWLAMSITFGTTKVIGSNGLDM